MRLHCGRISILVLNIVMILNTLLNQVDIELPEELPIIEAHSIIKILRAHADQVVDDKHQGTTVDDAADKDQVVKLLLLLRIRKDWSP